MSFNKEDLDIPQPRRARKIDEYSWKKICSKRARNIGKAYIYISLKNKYTCFGIIDIDKIKEILDYSKINKVWAGREKNFDFSVCKWFSNWLSDLT